jgi:hypothetical protein
MSQQDLKSMFTLMIQKPNCSPPVGRACSLHRRESQAKEVEHKYPECEGTFHQSSWNIITIGKFSQRLKRRSLPEDDGASQEWLFHHNSGMVHPAFLLQQILTHAIYSSYNLDVSLAISSCFQECSCGYWRIVSSMSLKFGNNRLETCVRIMALNFSGSSRYFQPIALIW